MLYDSIKRSSQMFNERRITIDEVNPAQLYITGHDAYKKTYRVNYDFHDPVLAIPIQGEMWIVSQYNNEWRLERRAETGSETTRSTDLVAGDRRIEANNNLYLNGMNVYVNKQDLLGIIADLQARITELETGLETYSIRREDSP